MHFFVLNILPFGVQRRCQFNLLLLELLNSVGCFIQLRSQLTSFFLESAQFFLSLSQATPCSTQVIFQMLVGFCQLLQHSLELGNFRLAWRLEVVWLGAHPHRLQVVHIPKLDFANAQLLPEIVVAHLNLHQFAPQLAVVFRTRLHREF